MTGEPELLPAVGVGARPSPRHWRFASRTRRLAALTARLELPVLLFIAFTLPFEFTKFWFPVSWLDLSRLGMLAGLAIVASQVSAGTLRLARAPLVVAIGAVVVVEVVSAITTQRAAGPKEAVAIVAYAGFAVFAGHVLSRPARLRHLALTLLGSAAIVAAVAVAQELGDFYIWAREGLEVLGRRNSTLGDPNITARFFAMMLAVALAMLTMRSILSARGWAGLPGIDASGRATAARRTVIVICLVIAAMAIADVLTLSRIGWLMAALALAMWLPLALRHRATLLGVIVFVTVFAGYLIGSPSVIDRASSVVGDALIRTGVVEPGEPDPPTPELLRPPDPAATTPVDGLIERLPLDLVRRYLLRAGVAMAIDHPLLGVGVGGYPEELAGEYSGFIPPERRSAPTLLIHTDAVRIASETGVVGLAAWGALLGATALAVWRGTRRWQAPIRLAAYAAGSVVVVILVASQFAGRFYTEPYLWLAIGVLVAVGHRRPPVRGAVAASPPLDETGASVAPLSRPGVGAR
jgi:hypothetical protein